MFKLAYPACVALGAVLLQISPQRGIPGNRMESFLRGMREVRISLPLYLILILIILLSYDKTDRTPPSSPTSPATPHLATHPRRTRSSRTWHGRTSLPIARRYAGAKGGEGAGRSGGGEVDEVGLGEVCYFFGDES